MDPLNVLGVIVILATIPMLVATVKISRIVVEELPPNTDKDAIETCLELFREAQHEIIMYDDGDTGEKSLYQSEDVVSLLEEKLADPQFHVRCMLNQPTGETRVEEVLKAFPDNAEIIHRTKDHRRVHYKIVDGRKAYVSCHDLGARDRSRKIIDCTRAMPVFPSIFKQRPVALRPYFADFDTHAA